LVGFNVTQSRISWARGRLRAHVLRLGVGQHVGDGESFRIVERVHAVIFVVCLQEKTWGEHLTFQG
jgi:hypothetical protein